MPSRNLVEVHLCDATHDDVVHVEGQRSRCMSLTDLFERFGVGEEIGAHAALVSRNHDAEQAGLLEVREILFGERGVSVMFGGARGKDLAELSALLH